MNQNLRQEMVENHFGQRNTDRGNQNSEHGNPGSEHVNPDSEHGNPVAEHVNPDSEHGNINSDHGNPSSEHDNLGSDHRNSGSIRLIRSEETESEETESEETESEETEKKANSQVKMPAENLLRGNVDVICLHYRNGRLVPLRIRVEDEDGEEHSYTIKDYRDLSGRGAYTTRDGIYVTDRVLFFECRIRVLGVLRGIRLYYSRVSQLWTVCL